MIIIVAITEPTPHDAFAYMLLFREAGLTTLSDVDIPNLPCIYHLYSHTLIHICFIVNISKRGGIMSGAWGKVIVCKAVISVRQ